MAVAGGHAGEGRLEHVLGIGVKFQVLLASGLSLSSAVKKSPRVGFGTRGRRFGSYRLVGYLSSAAISPRTLSKLTPRTSKFGCSRVTRMASMTKVPANSTASYTLRPHITAPSSAEV